MSTFTYAQLEQLWINAGGSKATAPVAAAIAEAESGGNPQATNPTDNNGTQTSWGLWQISNGTHAQPVPNILDPAVNARAAVGKYQASGWQPWGTYTSGAYQAFLANNVPPDPNVPPGGTGTQTTAATGSPCVISVPSVGPIGGGCLFSKSQARAMIGGLVLTGGVLLILPGLIILAAAGIARSGAVTAAGAVAAPLEKTPGYGHAIRAVRSRSQQRQAYSQGAQGERLRRARKAGRKSVPSG